LKAGGNGQILSFEILRPGPITGGLFSSPTNPSFTNPLAMLPIGSHKMRDAFVGLLLGAGLRYSLGWPGACHLRLVAWLKIGLKFLGLGPIRGVLSFDLSSLSEMKN